MNVSSSLWPDNSGKKLEEIIWRAVQNSLNTYHYQEFYGKACLGKEMYYQKSNWALFECFPLISMEKIISSLLNMTIIIFYAYLLCMLQLVESERNATYWIKPAQHKINNPAILKHRATTKTNTQKCNSDLPEMCNFRWLSCHAISILRKLNCKRLMIFLNFVLLNRVKILLMQIMKPANLGKNDLLFSASHSLEKPDTKILSILT